MYKNARHTPRLGFRPNGQTTSAISDGPTEWQRVQKAIYEQRIEADRQRQRAIAARRGPPKPAP